MKINDHFLFPFFQPEVTGNPRVVFHWLCRSARASRRTYRSSRPATQRTVRLRSRSSPDDGQTQRHHHVLIQHYERQPPVGVLGQAGLLRQSMTEAEIEIVLQRAREKYPEAKPRLISDNGPQFIAWDFKKFTRIAGMTHVRTLPYYPQSNGKLD